MQLESNYGPVSKTPKTATHQRVLPRSKKVSFRKSKSPIKINTLKEKSRRSSIRPPNFQINSDPNTARYILTTPIKFESSSQFKINHTQRAIEQKRLKITNYSSKLRDHSTSRTKVEKTETSNIKKDHFNKRKLKH